ncbi:PE family protein [Mycobacterium intermedium]|uniref:PE family protein n=1 Tax=Mycobacterium intermedium TaxID=28445 RepID=A0A1E3SIQ4_MYCIE|nr:hypothetical protein BHQ20_06210 [Mycobacterium intermedium]OPE51290.1 PE family protein [Mycobacterium intermedium]ORB05785.1 PE family protein [Mycobacterium intermedium]
MHVSYVIATPELIEAAAQELASIRASVAEATTAVSPSTTGIAAAAQDEVSAAVASLFGNFGNEFQALSAQAQAFHQQFVAFINAGANAYTSAESANAAASGLTAGLSAAAGEPTGLIAGLESFASAVAAPYQALGANTLANLQAIGNTANSNPFPLLRAIINNQNGYAQTIGASIQTGIQNLPSELANAPATIETGLQQLASFNPVPYVQGFINNQIAATQTIANGLTSAARDIGTGAQLLPAGFQAAFQDLLAGNNVAAYGDINTALVNAFFPGFDSTTSITPDESVATITITPQGPLGDLAPIFNLPAQMAQNFTNLLPAGSIPAQMAQNATNLVSALTNFGTTLTISSEAHLNFGVPLQLALDVFGAPVNALSSLNSSGAALASALQAGNLSAAAVSVLTAPANVANGFLNGTTVISLPPAVVSLFGVGLPSITNIPLGGLLAPLSLPEIFVDLDGTLLPLQLSGDTPVGGLIPGLLSFGPQLAQVITPIG